MSSWFKQFRYRLRRRPHFENATEQLKSLEGRYRTPEARLAIPFEYKGKGFFKSIKPMQSRDEITRFFSHIMELRPQCVVEIGTCHGGTLYMWCQAATPDALIVSIDLPEGEYGGGYPPERIPLYESFAQPGQRLKLLRGDSHTRETLEQLETVLGGQKVDFLFIDGDHRYEGVRADFDSYSRLVRPGGIIALHDILERPAQPDLEVHRFWSELRQQYSTVEFIERAPDQRKIGLGLVRC
jgi:predicted O-methyltransferase YrrM